MACFCLVAHHSCDLDTSGGGRVLLPRERIRSNPGQCVLGHRRNRERDQARDYEKLSHVNSSYCHVERATLELLLAKRVQRRQFETGFRDGLNQCWRSSKRKGAKLIQRKVV